MKSLQVEESPRPLSPFLDPADSIDRDIFHEPIFKKAIAIERKRSERSGEPFLLMLVESGDGGGQGADARRHVLERIIAVLLATSRETDIVGWYREHATVGVLFTGLMVTDRSLILSTLVERMSNALREELRFDDFSSISLSFHFFPEELDPSCSPEPATTTLYPDLESAMERKRSLLVIKRTVDILGSALALAVLSPLLLIIAAAVKLTSKGPVLFRQERVGQYGRLFTVLKFRSMYAGSDHTPHREYVTRLINDQAERRQTGGRGDGVYKLTKDRRITAVGRILRRTSLDELPQFVNVLRGEMSLVGPRPAIPYELAAYQTWHRRRILEAKPGITGLWQVKGRSLVKFDEMVRLDLRYANSWSLWLDLKILLLTPLAVIRGVGAY